MPEESIIKLSVKEWTHEQRISLARVSAQALTHSATILGESWSCQWWYDLITYLNVTQPELEARVLSVAQAVAHLSENRDIRIEALVDLLALTLRITPNAMQQDAQKSKAKHIMTYDARSRRFLLTLEPVMGLSRGDLASVEKSVAQQMYYGMLEQQGKEQEGQSTSMQQNMDVSAQKSMHDSNKKKQAFKWIATGAGIIGGGAVIGNKITSNSLMLHLIKSFIM
jgi:hypothetical protein